MSNYGTGLIARINLYTSRTDIDPAGVGFTVVFYVYTNRRKEFKSEELPRLETADGSVTYYALVDTAQLGHGPLLCSAVVSDPCAKWDGGLRPVVLDIPTRKFITHVGRPAPPCRPCPQPADPQCAAAYKDGYRMEVYFEDTLPEGTYILGDNRYDAETLTAYLCGRNGGRYDPDTYTAYIPGGVSVLY